jgi:transcriptional regulator with XRE-family HTH domain
MKKPQVGRALRQIRELKNLSQDFVAHNLGISTRAYSKIETEETQLTITRLYDLAEIFGVGVGDILGFEPQLVFNNSPNHQGGNYGEHIQQIKELFERLLEEKDTLIEELRRQLVH